MTEGLVGGEAFAVDASMVVADAHRQRGVVSSGELAPTSKRWQRKVVTGWAFLTAFPALAWGAASWELMQEAQAIMPFMASGPDGTPVPDVVIDYMFTDVPVELSDDIHRYRELVTQRRELDSALNELAARTIKRLRSAAGLTDEDSAAMLGISRQRVNQLRNA